MYELDIHNSSLISRIEYEHTSLELTIYFLKYYAEQLTYTNVPVDLVFEFMDATSFGKFYLSKIKPNFILKTNEMVDKPKTHNKASKEKRFIKFSLNVREIKKEWLHVGEKGGVYMNCTFHMMPDGEIDRFGNMGFVTQDPPKEVYTKDKEAKGEILGNGCEFVPRGFEGAPGTETGKLMGSDGLNDDLPF